MTEAKHCSAANTFDWNFRRHSADPLPLSPTHTTNFWSAANNNKEIANYSLLFRTFFLFFCATPNITYYYPKHKSRKRFYYSSSFDICEFQRHPSKGHQLKCTLQASPPAPSSICKIFLPLITETRVKT